MTTPDLPLEIDCRTLRERIERRDDLLLLDCREPDERQFVSLSGDVWVPMGDLAARLSELEPHRQRSVVVYCHVGGRSLRAARWLRQQGYGKAQSLAGGIDQWAVEIDTNVPRY